VEGIAVIGQAISLAIRVRYAHVGRGCKMVAGVGHDFHRHWSGWERRFEVWRDGRRRFGGGIRGRIGLRGVNLKTKPNLGCGRVLGALGVFGAIERGILIIRTIQGGIIWGAIIWGEISRGAAVGAAAAELMDGAFYGAVQAGFLAAEAVQEAFRDGIATGNEGEAAGVVKVAIPFVVLDRVFVLVPVEGDFHALNPRAAPGGHDDLADEGFFGGGGGLVLGVETVEEGIEFRRIFAG